MFRYIGSKSRLISQITPYTPTPCHIFEPFGGSFSLSLSLHTNTLSPFRPLSYTYADTDPHLCGIFEAIQDPHKLEQIIHTLRWEILSPFRYKELMALHETHKACPLLFPPNSPEVVSTTLALYAHSYGGKPNFSFSRHKSGRHHIFPLIERLTSYLPKVSVHNSPYNITLSPDGLASSLPSPAVVYLDPPYIGTEDYYTTFFTKEDHRQLAEILNQANYRWIISYVDDPWLGVLYPRYYVDRIKFTRKVQLEDRKAVSEILIKNF